MSNANRVLAAMRVLTDERQKHADIAAAMLCSQPEAYDVLSWMVDAGLANAHGNNEWTAGPEPRRLRAMQQAATDLLDAVGPTMPADIPPRLVDALLALQAAMVGR